MNPVKSLAPIGHWLLRIALVAIIYSRYFKLATDFSFSGRAYFIAFAYVVLAVLLFVGGFVRKNNLTVLSSLLITILSFVLMFLNGVTVYSILHHLPLAALGFYFLTKGNA